jgi:menaquinone-dependent protoporphyrinogen IX oxidase
MRNTLFISEGHYGNSKKVAEILALVVGYGKNVYISDAPKDISRYDSLVLIFSFYGDCTAEKLKKYLLTKKDLLKKKRIGVVGIGVCEKDIDNYVLGIENIIGKK